jgi:ABC-type multidrug transport system fused ATPase/permease subunit
MVFHQVFLTGESYDRSYSNKILLSRIWGLSHVPTKKLLFTSMLIVISQSCDGCLARLFWCLEIFGQHPFCNPSLNLFILLVSAVLFIEVMGFVFYYLLHRNMVRIIGYVIRDLTVDAFAASLRQDLAFHDNFSSGRIVSRITTDSEDFSMLIRLTTDVLSSGFLESVVTAIIVYSHRMATGFGGDGISSRLLFDRFQLPKTCP